MNEPYRASPANSTDSIALPRTQSLEPCQQQQHMGSPLPHPPIAQTGGLIITTKTSPCPIRPNTPMLPHIRPVKICDVRFLSPSLE